MGGYATAQAAQAQHIASHLQAPRGPPPSPTPDSGAPSPACPAQRAHAPPAPPPPCTPCQRGWAGGALHKQPWHSRQHHICRHAPVHHRRRPPPAAHPLPSAQRSAHTRRLLHHHPAHPASEAGWVGHCTSSHGAAGSITSAGTPRSTTVADPRRQRTLSRLPSAARTRAACSTTTLHTLPAKLGAWGTAQAALAQQAASHLQAPAETHMNARDTSLQRPQVAAKQALAEPLVRRQLQRQRRALAEHNCLDCGALHQRSCYRWQSAGRVAAPRHPSKAAQLIA